MNDFKILLQNNKKLTTCSYFPLPALVDKAANDNKKNVSHVKYYKTCAQYKFKSEVAVSNSKLQKEDRHFTY